MNFLKKLLVIFLPAIFIFPPIFLNAPYVFAQSVNPPVTVTSSSTPNPTIPPYNSDNASPVRLNVPGNGLASCGPGVSMADFTIITEPTHGVVNILPFDPTSNVPCIGAYYTWTDTTTKATTDYWLGSYSNPLYPTTNQDFGGWVKLISSPAITLTPTPTPNLITSPADGAVIAMTNAAYLSPQPLSNERMPAQRSLLVHGTVPCSCGVTVNGVVAKVSGSNWEAQLPSVQPGQLTITAQTDQGQQQSIQIRLIDIVISNPTENQSILLKDTPAMPDLNAKLQVLGLSDSAITSNTAFNWQLDVFNRWVTRTPPSQVSIWNNDTRTIATGTTTGSDAVWHPSYTTILGGWAKLTINANIPGVSSEPVVSEPRWFDLSGTNPSRASIQQFINSTVNNQNDNTALIHIACTESHYQQFTASMHNIDTLPQGIPSGWPIQPPSRPYFGPPAGIGIMQIDPAQFPDIQWNWQSNITAGIDVYNQKKANAAGYPGRVQQRLDRSLTNLVAEVNKTRSKRHLSLLNINQAPHIIVSNYTPNQLMRDTIRQYNGHHEYSFAARYAISPDGLGIQIVGQQQWIKATLKKNPGYVDKVLNCQ